MIKGVSNADVRPLVQKCKDFVTNNHTIFGRNYASDSDKWYAVYSYGEHFPMYVCDRNTGEWYANREKVSRTTSKHQGKAHPYTEVLHLSCSQMEVLAKLGPNKFAMREIEHAALGN